MKAHKEKQVKKTIKISMVLLALLMTLCTGCTAEQELPKVSEVGFYLDTVITLTAYTDDPQVGPFLP